MKKIRPLSKSSVNALRLMGLQIKAARLERGISQKDLADRIGASRFTVLSIEKGDPKVAVGYVFEAASTVGVPLLEEDIGALEKDIIRVSHFIALLPKKARKKEDLDDNF